jgi:hypothetical protein
MAARCVHGRLLLDVCSQCLMETSEELSKENKVMQCIHGKSYQESCDECVNMQAQEPQPTEITVEEVAALLRGVMATTTVIMECLANQTTRIERLEHALEERKIKEDNRQQHQDRDESRQTAETGGSDRAYEGERKAEEATVKMLGFDPPLVEYDSDEAAEAFAKGLRGEQLR